MLSAGKECKVYQRVVREALVGLFCNSSNKICGVNLTVHHHGHVIRLYPVHIENCADGDFPDILVVATKDIRASQPDGFNTFRGLCKAGSLEAPRSRTINAGKYCPYCEPLDRSGAWHILGRCVCNYRCANFGLALHESRESSRKV